MIRNAVLGLALIVASAPAFAQEGEKGDAKLKEIMSRLDNQKMALFEVNGESLESAVNQIKDNIHMDIVLGSAVRDAHQSDNITLRLTNCSVKSILKILLGDKGLTLVYRKGVLVIVDRKEVEQKTVTRVYDVRDLFYTIKPFPGPKVELVPPDAAGGTALSGAIFNISDEGSGPISQDFLTELIKSMTGNGKWDENPNAGIQSVNGLLIVTQTEKVQGEVGQLLGLIRQFK